MKLSLYAKQLGISYKLLSALQVFNQRQVQPGSALKRIYDLLFWQNYIPTQEQAQVQNGEVPANEDVNFANNSVATNATSPSPAAGSSVFSQVNQTDGGGKSQVKSGVTS